MPQIYLFNLDNQTYGLRKDEIETVLEVAAVHRLPFSPPFIVGLVSIEKRNTALADLAALLRHSGFDLEGPGHVLLAAGQAQATAFILSAPLTLADFPDRDIIPLVEQLRSPWISECLITDEQPRPLVNLRELYQHVIATKAAKPLPHLSLKNPTAPFSYPPDGDLRLFSNGSGELFAFPAEGTGRVFPRPAHSVRLLLNERQTRGAIFLKDEGVVPLLNPDWLNDRQKQGAPGQVLVIDVDGLHYGVLIGEDLGNIRGNDGQRHNLPPLLANSAIDSLFYWQQKIIPVIAPAQLLAARETFSTSLDLQPDSTFPERFGRQEVKILEFSLLGGTHAIPRSEVEDIVPIGPVRALPGSTSLVIGISEYHDELLPVLDIALVFGRRSLVDRNWQMILVKNGLFRGFILAGMSGEKDLSRDSQKKVPISLRENLVYGCYPIDGGVRLIFNIAALAGCFDKILVREFIPTMTREMLEAPARLMPELLSDDQQDQLATAETPTVTPPVGSAPFVTAPETHQPPPDLTLAEELEHQLLLTSAPEPFLLHSVAEPPTTVETGEEQVEVELAAPLSRTPQGQPGRAENFTPAPDPSRIPIIPLESVTPDENSPPLAFAAGQESPAVIPTADEAGEVKESPAESFALKLAEARDELARLVAEREELRKNKLDGHEDAPAPAAKAAEERRPDMEARLRLKPGLAKLDPELTAKKRREEKIQLQTLAKEQPGLEKPPPGKLPEKIQPDGKQDQTMADVGPTPAKIVGRITTDEEKRDLPPPSRSKSSEAHNRRKRLNRIFIWLSLMLLFDLWLYYDLHFDQKSPEGPIPVPAEQAQKSPPPAETPKAEHLAPPSSAGQPGPVEDHPPPAPVRNGPPSQELVIVVPDDAPFKSGTYEIKAGDTLWGIAQRFTGNPYNYPVVARDNSIPDPDLIYPEQKIILRRKTER